MVGSDGSSSDLMVDVYQDTEYVRTIPDKTKTDNLLALPEEEPLFGK